MSRSGFPRHIVIRTKRAITGTFGPDVHVITDDIIDTVFILKRVVTTI